MSFRPVFAASDDPFVGAEMLALGPGDPIKPALLPPHNSAKLILVANLGAPLQVQLGEATHEVAARALFSSVLAGGVRGSVEPQAGARVVALTLTRVALEALDGQLLAALPAMVGRALVSGLAERVARRVSAPPAYDFLAEDLVSPRYAGEAGRVWVRARIAQLVVLAWGEVATPAPSARGSETRHRVAKARELLAGNMENPPPLPDLAKQVGLSPFHLSRMFSQIYGETISRFVRRLRLERAATLLETGRYTVTEAAFEVGYQSLGHFSEAFCEQMGCCPALYPLIKR